MDVTHDSWLHQTTSNDAYSISRSVDILTGILGGKEHCLLFVNSLCPLLGLPPSSCDSSPPTSCDPTLIALHHCITLLVTCLTPAQECAQTSISLKTHPHMQQTDPRIIVKYYPDQAPLLSQTAAHQLPAIVSLNISSHADQRFLEIKPWDERHAWFIIMKDVTLAVWNIIGRIVYRRTAFKFIGFSWSLMSGEGAC